MRDPHTGRETVQHVSHNPKFTSVALASGTVVLTLRGALPVEQLHRGDRVITKSGGTVLKRVHSHDHRRFWLEFDNPEVVYVVDGQYLAQEDPDDEDALDPEDAAASGHLKFLRQDPPSPPRN